MHLDKSHFRIISETLLYLQDEMEGSWPDLDFSTKIESMALTQR